MRPTAWLLKLMLPAPMCPSPMSIIARRRCPRKAAAALEEGERRELELGLVRDAAKVRAAMLEADSARLPVTCLPRRSCCCEFSRQAPAVVSPSAGVTLSPEYAAIDHEVAR